MTGRTYPGAQPFLPEEDRAEILAAISGVLESGILAHGRYVRQFEAAAAEMAGVRHAIAVNSGGTAIELALEALGVEGADVVVPTETFVATANSVVRAGGRPVFADLRLEDLSVSVDSIAAAVTARTKAVIIVQMFGLMSAEIPAIQKFCAERGLALLEDAAHAHGATIGGQRAGALGIAACFSYYATKILTTGEGGVITTDDDDLAERVRTIREHGRITGSTLFGYPGNNYRLAEIPAIIGCVQHRRLPEILAHRRKIAAIYRDVLAGTPDLTLIDPRPHGGHSYWRYVALLDGTIDRNAVQAEMNDIGARVTWMYEPLCHQQPYYRDRAEYAKALPVAESVVGRLINLPTHTGVDEDGARLIAESLQHILRKPALQCRR